MAIQEFFYRLPFETMDLLWYAQEQNIPITEISKELDLTLDQVQRAFTDFTRKQRTTDYLRLPPIQVDDSKSPSD